MARGKLLKTKVKEAVLEASCVAEAIKLAQAKAEQKVHEKKSLWTSAREHIGKMVDRVDPLELGAVVALTVLIQPIINKMPEFINTYVTSVERTVTGLSEIFTSPQAKPQVKPFDVPFVGARAVTEKAQTEQLVKGELNLVGGLTGFLGWLPFIRDVAPELDPASKALYRAADTLPGGKGPSSELSSDVLMSYLIAFVVAFIIVRYGGDVLKGLGGITGFAKLLFL